MKWTVLAGIVALTCGCGGPRSSSSDAERQPSASPGNPPAAQPGASASLGMATGTTNSAANQQVTLVGCLQGPPAGGDTAGTSGTRDRSATGRADTSRDSISSAYRLVDATAASSDSAGTGVNGAGASGGPLVSGRSAYVLDGIPEAARGNVNRQVRVVGRLDAMSAPAPTRRIRVENIEVVAATCSAR